MGSLSGFDRRKETQDKEIMFCHIWTCSKYIHLGDELVLDLNWHIHFLQDVFQNKRITTPRDNEDGILWFIVIAIQ